MNGKETVSVVVPFYNRSSFLDRLIRSVTNQTMLPGQLFIIDNGSSIEESKAAWEIISRNKSCDVEIIFVSTLNKSNANYARNLGIEISIAEYVAFLDSDDWWEPNHLENSIKILSNSRKPCIYSGAIIHGESKWLNYSADVNNFRNPTEFLFSKSILIAQTSSYIVKRKVIQDKEITWSVKLKRHQDYDFFLSVYYLSDGWCYSDSPTSNVDWKDGGTKKNFDFKSMIRFLDKWEGKFTKQALNNYLLNQILICRKTDPTDRYSRYYKKRLLRTNKEDKYYCQLFSVGKLELRLFILNLLGSMHIKGIILKVIRPSKFK
jgi:glycosyltransferase involved in cell wall biosynthesis